MWLFLPLLAVLVRAGPSPYWTVNSHGESVAHSSTARELEETVTFTS